MDDANKPVEEYIARIEELETRLEEAEDTLRAIQSGEVDALVVAGPEGHQIYTLKGEEHTYRLLVESMNEGALILTTDGAIMYANRVLAEMLGRPLERIMGLDARELVADGEWRMLDELIRVACKSTARGEVRVRRAPHGELMPVYVSLSPLLVDEALAISMVVTDLTERKQAEEKLRQYQDHLEELVQERTEQVQVSREELAASNEELAAINEELRTTNEQLQNTTEHLRREVEERKRAEEGLRESEERLSLLFNTMLQGVVQQDADGRIMSANPAAERILGHPLGEMLGQTSVDREPYCTREDGTLFPGLEHPAMVALQTGEKVASTVMGVYNPREKECRWISISAVPMFRDGEDKPHQVYSVFEDITERKRAEEQIRSLALFPSENPGPILRVSGDGDVTYANEATSLLTDWGGDGGDLRIPKSILDAVKDALVSGESRTVDVECCDKTYSFVCAPIVDSGYVNLYGRDVTERKQAEEALRESEKTFFDLVEGAPFGIYIIDSQFRIAHMNIGSQNGAFQNVRPVTGRDFSEAMHILWPDDVAEGIIAAFRHTLETGEPYYSPRFTNPRHDVEIRESYEWELHRIALPSGEYGVVCYYFDSTELREAEEALRESERMYRAIGESIDYGVWVCAPDGRNIYASESFLKMVGITQEQCSAFGWGDVLHPDDTERTIAEWKECVRTGGNWDIEHRFRGVDGKWHTVLARGVPVRDEQGQVTAWAGINLDITDLKRAEEQVLRQNALVEGINRVFHEALTSPTEADLGQTCLAVAEGLTQSKFGFIGEIGSDGSFADIAISDPGWDACQVIDPSTGRRWLPSNLKIHGIYGRVILDGKGFFTNDPPAHVDSIGLPEGHPAITAFLGVPLTYGGKVLGMLGVGNRDGGYDEEDLETMESLAPAIVEAFLRKRAEEAVRESEENYRSLFEMMLEGFCIIEMVFDEDERPIDYRFLVINPTFEEQTGLHDARGKLISELAPGLEAHWIETYGKIALTGEPARFVNEVAVLGRWFDVSAYRVGGQESRKVAVLFNDITEQHVKEVELADSRAESERRAAELESFFSNMVEGAVLHDADGNVLLSNKSATEILGATVQTPVEKRVIWTLDGTPMKPEETATSRALRGEKVQDLRVKVKTPGDVGKVISVSSSPVFSARGSILGATTVLRDVTSQTDYERQQQEMLDREHHIAEVLQRALIPDADYNIPGVEIAVRYEAALREAQVGGDFYDVFDMGDNKIGLLLGDVAGKGLAAAIQVASARHSFRSYAYIDPRPERVMSMANDALCKDTVTGLTMLTAFFAVIDLDLGVMSYANGGHEIPLLKRADGTIEELHVEGRALGVRGGYDYVDGGVILKPGDLVTIVTDGIIEARPNSRNLFGLEGMKSFLLQKPRQTPEKLAEGILNAAKKHAGGALSDDAAVLVFGLRKVKKRR